MIWNVEDCTSLIFVCADGLGLTDTRPPARTDNKPASWPASSKWAEALNARIFALPDFGPPRFRHNKWPLVFDLQAGFENPLFSTPIGEEKVPWTVWLEKDAVWNRVHTLSHVYTLEGEDKASFKAKFDEEVNEKNGEVNGKGEIGVHGVTLLAWSRKL